MNKGRKISGGKYVKSRKKKKYERPGNPRVVRLGTEKTKVLRIMGGNKKSFLLVAKFVNVRTGSHVKRVEIKNVVETPSNRFLARQNIITKGAILDTELGKIKVTNRPGQESVVNGILIEKINFFLET